MDDRELAYSLPLDKIDVSDSGLYETDSWRPYFERLRHEDPVHYCPDSAFGPYWSITKFNDCIRVEKDYELFSSEPSNLIADPEESSSTGARVESFIAMDPPRHGERRAIVQPIVEPRSLANFEPLIRERAIRILEELPVGKTFDWVSEVAIHLTSQMLATLFNFEQSEREKLVYWSDAFTDGPTFGSCLFSAEERNSAYRDFFKTFAVLFEERSRTPVKDDQLDLLSMLARGDSTKDILADRRGEFFGTIALLIVGGNDTTRNSISGGVLALNQFPEQYEKLKSDHSLIESMVPEIIRWQTPAMYQRRTMTREAEFGGKLLRAGDKVVLWYISANRDESVIENADDFDIDRKDPRHHLSFGFGVHRCMGNRLAEMQLRVLWEEILQRFEHIEVMGPAQRLRSNHIRGITGLPVRVARK